VLGVKNGKLLDLEFQAAHHPLSHKIDNAEGRLFFLKHVTFVSPASHQLSLPLICQMQIHPHSQPEQSKKKPGM
jgi:hypothetical protein